jgi:hypothetical protein
VCAGQNFDAVNLLVDFRPFCVYDLRIMAIPISAAKALDRKEASATRRLASLYTAIKEIETELAEIRTARATLSHPTNGKKVKLPKIIGDLRVTKKDHVLAAVSSRPITGMTRRDIADYIRRSRGIDMNLSSVTSYLYFLSRDGLVEFNGETWVLIK